MKSARQFSPLLSNTRLYNTNINGQQNINQVVSQTNRAIYALVKSGHTEQAKTMIDQVKNQFNMLSNLREEETLRGAAAGSLFALQITCMRQEELMKVVAGEQKPKLTQHTLLFDSVLKIVQDVEFMQTCANTFQELGIFEYAKLYYQKLVETVPDSYAHRYNLAHIYELMDHNNMAIQHYKTLIQTHPKMESPVSLRISSCLERVGEVVEAARAYEIHSKVERDAVDQMIGKDGQVAKHVKDYLDISSNPRTYGWKLDKVMKSNSQLAYLYVLSHQFAKADQLYEKLSLILTGLLSEMNNNQDQIATISQYFVSHGTNVVYDWITCLRKIETKPSESRINTIQVMLELMEGVIKGSNVTQGVDMSQGILLLNLCKLHTLRFKTSTFDSRQWQFIRVAHTFADTLEQKKLVIWEAVNLILLEPDAAEHFNELMTWASLDENIFSNNPTFWSQIRKIQDNKYNVPSNQQDHNLVLLDIVLQFHDKKKNTSMCRKYRVMDDSIERAQKTVIDFESLRSKDVAIMAIEKHSQENFNSILSQMLVEGSVQNKFIYLGIIQTSVSAPV
ncbi:hypothetical protein AKO1_007437 [Acrasis kona]|uniref:Uncharacterized protein n=1 Tax=Acrasis kona TaxID=1008807 RepID=A0AAW2YRZ9_9EUKA